MEWVSNYIVMIILAYTTLWGLVHYGDVIMGAIASQITSLATVYSIVYTDADQRKHRSSASLAFVRGIHRGPVNSPHKWPVTRKMVPFDDVIIYFLWQQYPDSKVHWANMGPTWVLSAPDGPHVGPMNLTNRVTPDILKAPCFLLCDKGRERSCNCVSTLGQ